MPVCHLIALPTKHVTERKEEKKEEREEEKKRRKENILALFCYVSLHCSLPIPLHLPHNKCVIQYGGTMGTYVDAAWRTFALGPVPAASHAL